MMDDGVGCSREGIPGGGSCSVAQSPGPGLGHATRVGSLAGRALPFFR